MVKATDSRVEALMAELASLSEQELAELRRRIASDPELRAALNSMAGEGRRRDVRGLRGLGKEYWRNIDADAYVAAERASWGS